MIRIITILLLLTTTVNAATHYISNSGSGNGLTQGAPQSKTAFDASMLVPGDIYLFNRGERYTPLTLNQSGTAIQRITIDAYGTGADPIFTTLENVTGWVSIGSGLYEKTLANPPPTMLNTVIFNGKLQGIGRYPKANLDAASYLTIDTFTTNNSRWTRSNGTITSTGLTTNYTGGTIVQRTPQWVLDRGEITSQTGTTLSYASEAAPDHATVSYIPEKGHGFFIQNHISTLTQLGDWAYNNTTKKLTMYFGAANPTSHSVQVPTGSNVVSLISRGYITFQNVQFNGSNTDLVNINASSNLTFTNCTFSNGGVNGIDIVRGFAYLSGNNTVTNSTFRSINNNAINAVESTGWSIANNTIDTVGMISGMGLSGDGQYVGIYKTGSNSIIEYNTVKNIGYNGIWFDGSNSIVRYNDVSYFCMNKSDGGGIYTYGNHGTNRLVHQNTVHDGPGNKWGTGEVISPHYYAVHGIYMDSHAENVSITNNSSYRNGTSGLWLGSNRNITATGNNLFDNRTAQIKGVSNEIDYSNIVITNNTFFASEQGMLLSSFNINPASLAAMTLNNNYYARPISEPNNINGAPGYSAIPFSWNTYHDNGVIEYDNKFYSLDRWKVVTGKDAASAKTYATVTSTGKIKILTNPINANTAVNLDSAYRDVAGNVVYSSINLSPYSSRILLNAEVNATAPKGVRGAKRIVIVQSEAITPDAPVIYANDEQNTITATHALGTSEILVSVGGGTFQPYAGTMAVPDLDLPAGHYQFKTREATGRTESLISSSPAFTQSFYKPSAPTVNANDSLNTLSAGHDTLPVSQILVSVNDADYVPYTGGIDVGNVVREIGYWKFKIAADSTIKRLESNITPSPAFTVTIDTPAAPLVFGNDSYLIDTLSAYSSYSISMSVNNGAWVAYTGTISVGNVARAAGYWRFSIDSATNQAMSAIALSPAFTTTTVNVTPAPPTISANDLFGADTLSASHALGTSEIVYSENNEAFQQYTGTIQVGNNAYPAGYWQFKIKSAFERNESSVVLSPAFTITETPTPPVLQANDVTNTLSASHPLGISEILVSVNNGTYVSYTGQISVGNVARAEGYWKFKIRSATNRNESDVALSPAFTVEIVTPVAPTVSANDTYLIDTISATHPLGASEILVSTNNGAYVQYTGVISVGNNARSVGYYKFKTKAATNRNESPVAESPAFTTTTIATTPDAPLVYGDDDANTLTASHELGNSEIIYSFNGGTFQPYNGTIQVGNVILAAGAYVFKIKSAFERNESATTPSPAFTITPAPPTVTGNDVTDVLSASSPLGQSEILVSVNNATYVAYTGQINVGNVARETGYWKFKIRAATGRQESAVVNSPAFNVAAVVGADSSNFSFVIKETSATTSAGVYDNDVLLRTIWSAVPYTQGTHVGKWDGLLDNGTAAPKPRNAYNIQVLSNNIQYQWEGGRIGNTSDSLSGPKKWRGFQGLYDMAVWGNNAYFCLNFSEGWNSNYKVNLLAPQSKTELNAGGWGQATKFVATDGNIVYWAGGDPMNGSRSFIFGTNVSNDLITTFSTGTSMTFSHSKPYTSVIDKKEGIQNSHTGLAIMKTGNYLFSARGGLNLLTVLNKTTGAFVRDITTFVNPRGLVMDGADKLWMIHDTKTIQKYNINSDGTLTATGLTITTPLQPLRLGVSPDNSILAVVDGSTSQQVKAYSNSTGTLQWTHGQAGGYMTNATVADDKFYLVNRSGYTNIDFTTFIAYQTDGSFWLGDGGNYRAQHFSAARAYIKNIMYYPHSYSAAVDPNNPTKVFNGFWEYKIDYSKPLDNGVNGSWKLVNSWKDQVPNGLATGYEFHMDNEVFKDLATLPNGRTYGTIYRPTPPGTNEPTTYRLFELGSNGVLRNTGISFPRGGIERWTLLPSGRLSVFTSNSNVYEWKEKPLTGYDASNNPVWGTSVTVNSATTNPATDPTPGLANVPTTNSVYPIFGSGRDVPRDTGFHLMGIKNNKITFRTGKATYTAYKGPMPKDGAFDIGNSVQYAGGGVTSIDSSIIWNYRGEFWKNRQTNIFNQYHENGLMINQFGTTTPEWGSLNSPPMVAGNVFKPYITKVGANYYLYHQEESPHSALHRWKISNISSVKVQTATLTTDTVPALPGVDLMAGLPNTYNATLVNNTNGWTRSPVTDYYTDANNNFRVVFGLKSYDRFKQMDMSIAYRQASGTAHVTRSLGTNTGLTYWSVKGKINFEGQGFNEASNTPKAGSYVEILDGSDRIIARFYYSRNSTGGSRLQFNDKVIVTSTTGSEITNTFFDYRDIEFTNSGGLLTFRYGSFPSVSTTAVITAGADKSAPAKLRFYFFTNNAADNLGRNLSIKEWRFENSAPVVAGNTVPFSLFGNHILGPLETNVGLSGMATLWPPWNPSSIRMHDTYGYSSQQAKYLNITWKDMEPSAGVYDFTLLDKLLDKYKAKGVTDIVYTFIRTPAFYGGGTSYTLPPNDLSKLTNFITALANRAISKGWPIRNWEIWNEPNSSGYYIGSINQMVAIAQTVYNAVKAVDPTYKVISPSTVGYSTNTTLLSATTANPSTDPTRWMATFLSAGGGAYCDVMAFHGYMVNRAPEDISTLINTYKTIYATYGQTGKEIWNTESYFNNPPTSDSYAQQGRFLAINYILQWVQGINKYFWHTWDLADNQYAIQWTPAGGINANGVANQQIINWMVGATVNNLVVAGTVYTCDVVKDGIASKIVWNSAGSSAYSTTHTSYKTLAGATVAVVGGTVTIGQTPILLTTIVN